jgi:hypothetical protein
MAKKPKAAAKPKTAKKKAASTAPDAKKPNSLTAEDAQQRALFIGKGGHLETIRGLKSKLETANSNLRAAYKKAKADGFEKSDFEYAFQLEAKEGGLDPEKEAKTKARIARNLTIAKFLGSALGTQLDFFLEPDRTPAVETAYDEGVQASMKGETAKPGYDPSTPQHAEYMRGYHDDQEKRVKNGIGKLHPAVAEDQVETAKVKAKTKAQKEADAKAFEAPADVAAPPVTSGVAVSRVQFLAQQKASEAAAAQGESAFAKKH